MMTAFFERFDLDLPADAVAECSRPGAVDAEVTYWAARIERPAECSPEALRAELREHGAWDDSELSDDAANWERVVWIAACNAAEEAR